MYGATGQSGDNAYKLTHENNNTSIIKGAIDSWYVNDTNLSNLRTTYLADAGFCNDRSVAPTANTWYSIDTALGYGINYTYYGVYSRLMSSTTNASKEKPQPQFLCPNAENDLFTTNASSKGNQALTNPIGLITADEVVYAGGVYGTTNASYYLNVETYYWTMSPTNYFMSRMATFRVFTDGKLDYINLSGQNGIRPVINLNSTVELSSELPDGCTELNGTASCPYIIKTN